MNLQSDQEKIAVAKQNLQIVMQHQLDVLREIFSSMRQEYEALKQKSSSVLNEISQCRPPLFVAFERWQSNASHYIHELVVLLALDKNVLNVGESFIVDLDLLKKILEPDDIELLMLHEELGEILNEIQDQSATTLHFLEDGKNAEERLIRIPDEQTRAFQVAIGLLDPEEDSESDGEPPVR